MVFITRVARAGLVAALLVAFAGWALQRDRFGTSDAAALARIKAELQQRVHRSADTLGRIASQLARERSAIQSAARDTTAAKQLFAAADAALPNDEATRTGISVYDRAGTPLAWAGRVSELPKQRLNEPASLSVHFGEPGPRLFRIEPLFDRTRPLGQREATIVVEQTLGRVQGGPGSAGTFVVSTSIVPVMLRARGDARPRSDPYRFAIVSRDGTALIDAVVAPSDLADARVHWTQNTQAAVLGVLVVTLLLCTGPMVELRRRTRSTRVYVTATAGLAGAVLVARAMFLLVASLVIGPRPSSSPLDVLLKALTAAALVWLALDLVERRRLVRPSPRLLAPTMQSAALVATVYFAVGILDTWLLWRYERALNAIVSETTFDLLHFTHYPVSWARLSLAFGVVLLHAAMIWLAAAIIRLAGIIWRTPRRIALSMTVVPWLLGVVLAMAWIDRVRPASVPAGPLFVALVAAGACAAVLGYLGGRARRASQATRLFALLLVLLVPALAMYPSFLAFAIDAQERLVATKDGPQAASQRKDLQDRTRLALEKIDAMPALASLVMADGDNARPASDRAFRVWSQTDLALHRLTSAVELYGADGRLVSRFALNLPEYAVTRYRAAGCNWNLFDEPSPLGSNVRHVLVASRAICEDGRTLGSLVVRAMLDYRTLPFIVSQSPYLESLRLDRQPSPEGLSGREVEFVVYGWSRAPLFASGTSVWSLPDAVFQQMVDSGTPVWDTITRAGKPFRVYFFSDRGGIYALGYPVITWFDHLINLAELGTLTFVLYVILLGSATLFNALTSRTPASGRALLREVRSSFYRKLFLAFVAGAVLPVVILAVATRTYLATELRAGIDEAAAKTATVAERLVEDYAALQQRGPGGLEAIDDQIMVLVGRAIDQDVNLFDRAGLQATSERDLFESQLLSTRTPADAYRTILLDRLPTFVGEEEVGDFTYRVAAAPVRAGGREGIVTVPLPLRQQEIEQQIDELDHRVLFGAVLFSLLGAALGYWMAERIADPVNRLTRATRRIARGDLDARIATTSSDELRRLVEDFNQMAADLKRQRADLERTQRLEAWADMAHQVAHDIKNPLTPIQLSAEHARRVNLDRGRPLSPVLDDCVNAILTQVALLRQIAAEFSSFASSPTPRPEPTALPALLEQVVEPYRAGLGGRIVVEIAAPSDLPLVHIDRTLFSRALTNVIENALYAMPGTGKLTIGSRQSPVDSRQSPVDSRPSTEGSGLNRTVIVEITDTGVGMDPQALEKIFEPYFSTKTTGTGLGLTIAKRNIELNGGTIAVTSEREVGTKVTITLPT